MAVTSDYLFPFAQVGQNIFRRSISGQLNPIHSRFLHFRAIEGVRGRRLRKVEDSDAGFFSLASLYWESRSRSRSSWGEHGSREIPLPSPYIVNKIRVRQFSRI